MEKVRASPSGSVALASRTKVVFSGMLIVWPFVTLVKVGAPLAGGVKGVPRIVSISVKVRT